LGGASRPWAYSKERKKRGKRREKGEERDRKNHLVIIV
jgi:hypothetical protein